MSLRFEEQQVRLETFIGRNVGQVIAEGLVEVPQDLPVVGEVLVIKGIPQINETTVNPGSEEVVVTGKVNLQMIYGGEGEGNRLPVYSVNWPEALSFYHRVEIPGVKPNSRIHAQVRVENMEYNVWQTGFLPLKTALHRYG